MCLIQPTTKYQISEALKSTAEVTSLSWHCGGLLITDSAISDERHLSGSRGTDGDEDESFLSFEKLLQEGAGEAQESQHCGLLSGRYKS